MDGFSQFLTNLNRISNIRTQKVYKKRTDPFTKYTDSEFRSKYRFSKINMRYIINLVKDDLEGCKRGGKIPVDLQVIAAIWYWGRNEIQDDCADIHGFSQQTLSRVCRNVAIAFARKAPDFIKMPASLLEEQAAVITGFHAISGFHGVVGAIDCTHIRIKKVSGEIGPLYINRKGYYSLDVQVVCDAKLKIRDIVAHWRGSAHDSRIFRESSIRQRFENNEFRGRLVGDGGYACTPYLFVPLRNPTNPSEMDYNKAKISTRNVANGFNRELVTSFFDLLEAEYQKHPYTADRIFNVDETGLRIVQRPSKKRCAPDIDRPSRERHASEGEGTSGERHAPDRAGPSRKRHASED